MLNYSFHALFFLVLNFISCKNSDLASDKYLRVDENSKANSIIHDIMPPRGFSFYKSEDSLFANWLLNQKLRNDNKVYLYNGELKQNQKAQYAVLEIDIGKKNLVQCADAVIKLRAEYLFEKNQFEKIVFLSTSGEELSFSKWQKGTRWKESNGKLVEINSLGKFNSEKESFQFFMELVYSYCGTYSLNKQLSAVSNISDLQPGNVFVQGGFPGHAVLVLAVVISVKGEKMFLLSQGYMPAQDIHILINPADTKISPWYKAKDIYPLITPQWIFEKNSLKKW